VKPILEVLVGKTVEQALLEVMEEEELANLRAQQRAFEELRNAELVETQRLEEQERRHREDKERRMKQQREVLKKEKETSEKIAARAFAQSYLADLVPSVFGTLNDNGYFYDPVERDVELGFMPWLMDEVAKRIDESVLGRTVLDGIIQDVVKERMAAHFKLEESAQTNIELIAEAAQQIIEEQMLGGTDQQEQAADETQQEAGESRPETAPDQAADEDGEEAEGDGDDAE